VSRRRCCDKNNGQMMMIRNLFISISQMMIHNNKYKQLLSSRTLFKVFSDEAHMSGSEIDDGTDKATAWKKRLDIINLIMRETVESRRTNTQRTSQGTSDV
jgi:hypothetical protein